MSKALRLSGHLLLTCVLGFIYFIVHMWSDQMQAVSWLAPPTLTSTLFMHEEAVALAYGLLGMLTVLCIEWTRSQPGPSKRRRLSAPATFILVALANTTIHAVAFLDKTSLVLTEEQTAQAIKMMTTTTLPIFLGVSVFIYSVVYLLSRRFSIFFYA